MRIHKITINDPEVIFEGNLDHFQNCYFTIKDNAKLTDIVSEILDFCENNFAGSTVKIEFGL